MFKLCNPTPDLTCCEIEDTFFRLKELCSPAYKERFCHNHIDSSSAGRLHIKDDNGNDLLYIEMNGEVCNYNILDKLFIFESDITLGVTQEHETNIHGLSVQNSPQELTVTGCVSGYLNQAWQWLCPSDNGQLASNEEGTELTEVISEGGVLRREAESLRSTNNELPVPGPWGGTRFQKGLVAAGLLGTGFLARTGYQRYAGRPDDNGTAGNSTQSGPSGTFFNPAMSRNGSAGTLQDGFGNHSLPHHDDTGNGTRHRRRHQPEYGPVSHPGSQPPSDGIKPSGGDSTTRPPSIKKNSPSSRKNKSSIRLVRMLQKADFLDTSRKPRSFTKAEMVAAVGHLLYGQDHKILYGVSDQDKRLINTARYILRAEGLYGAKAGENVTPELAGAVIRNWFFENTLGMSAESYLAGKVTYLRHHGNVKAGTLVSVLRAAMQDMNKDLQSLSEGRKMLFLKLCDYALDYTFPFSNLPVTDPIQSLSITDDAFVWTHTGALWLADAGGNLRNINTKECRVVGKALWEMAESGDIPVNNMKYLRLPALLFQVTKFPDGTRLKKRLGFGDILKVVSEYADYRRTTRAVYEDFRAKTEDFKNKLTDWKSRGKIADGYVSQCPREQLISMGRENPPVNIIPGSYPEPPSQDEKFKDGKFLAKEAYLDGITKEGCPHADVTSEFTSKTRRAADAFAKVDEYFIAMALAELPLSEQDFIRNKNAVINKLSSKMTNYIGPGVYVIDKTKELQNTDLFSVTVGEEERVYAFIADDKGGYKVERLDRDPAKYIQHDLFGIRKATSIIVNKNDKVLTPPIFAGASPQRWNINFSKGTAISENSTSFDNLVQYVKEKHHKEFYDQTYTAGYDASLRERSWNFYKHFIPFYDCSTITLKNADDLGTCMLDVLSFIPLTGEAASLGGKFGASLARGVRAGMSTVSKGILSPKIISGQVLKEISLPTVREMTSLGKSTLRALDPGIELLSDTGKYTYNGMQKLVNWVRKGKSVDDIRVMENLLKKIPSGSSVKPGVLSPQVPYKMASLPNSEIKVPVTAVGKEGGRDIYVVVRPDTGEKFGKRYLINSERSLELYTSKKTLRDKVSLVKKEPDMSYHSCSVGRVKRGLDAISKPAQNNYPDDNKFTSVACLDNNNESYFLNIVRISALKRLNPVRYEIIRKSFANQLKISDAAILKLNKMSTDALVNFFKEKTGVTITKANAAALRKNIIETNAATKVFYSEMDTRVVISLLDDDDKASSASYTVQGGLMLLNERIFREPAAEIILRMLHESSHAIGTKDFIYLNYSLYHYRDVAELERFRLLNTNKNAYKYFNNKESEIKKNGLIWNAQSEMETLFLDGNVNKFKELMAAPFLTSSFGGKIPPPFEHALVNSADTVSYIMMMLSGVSDRRWYRKNKVVLEDISVLMAAPENQRNFRTENGFVE